MPATERGHERAGGPSHAVATFERRYRVRHVWLEALTVTAIAAVAASLLAMWLPATRPTAYDLLTNEEGPVELATFLAFVVAAFVSARAARDAGRRGGSRAIPFVYGTFAALCLFAAIEEISWGQALFDFRTPEWLWNVNEQGETNLHNLQGVMDYNSACVMAFGLLGLIGVALGTVYRLRWFVVPRPLWALFALVAAMGALETYVDFVVVRGLFARVVGTASEMVELLGAVACLAYAWLNARMLRREAEVADAIARRLRELCVPRYSIAMRVPTVIEFPLRRAA